MTVFIYKGLQTDGSVIEGEVHAQVPQDAYRKMELLGLRPILVHEVCPEQPPSEFNEPDAPVAGQVTSVPA